MRYEIWHGTRFDRETCEFTERAYCGYVEAESLEGAYLLTNSVEAPWIMNRAVCPAYPEGGFGETEVEPYHSTSPGDAFVDEDGVCWKCERLGWSKIERPALYTQK